jgi:hypothetical protein
MILKQEILLLAVSYPANLRVQVLFTNPGIDLENLLAVIRQLMVSIKVH